MWKYIKDYLVRKLISKWIIEAEPVPSADSPSTAPKYFQHYKNIKLNPSIELNNGSLEIVEGQAEEVSVQIDWMEMLKYWSEIKSKYHIETEFDDDADDYSDTKNTKDTTVNGSELVIKDLYLQINTHSHTSTFDKSHEDEPQSLDPDLLKDFLDHLIGQFKVKIDNLTVILNDKITICTTEPVLIHPEVNGVRRIHLPEITVKESDNDTVITVRKGTEVTIIKAIEGVKVKINVPGIDLETEDITLSGLRNVFDNKSTSKEHANPEFEFELEIGHLNLQYHQFQLLVNDIYFNNTGQFVTGHFKIKWNGSMIVDSPIQSQVIRGNYKEGWIELDDEIYARIEDLGIIQEIMSLKHGDSVSEANYSISVNVNKICISVEDIKSTLSGISLINDRVTIQLINLIHNDSQISIQDISYVRLKNTIQSPVQHQSQFPFAELKRFIENDEIISLEKRQIFLKDFVTESDQLDIQRIFGKVTLLSILELLKLESKIKGLMFSHQHTNDNSVVGIIKELDIELLINRDLAYKVDLNNLEFIKTSSFLDLRSQLKSAKRNDKLLLESGQIDCTATECDCVIEVDGVIAHVPYNIIDLVTQDVKDMRDIGDIGVMECRTIGTNTNNSTVSSTQLLVKDLKFDLEGPDHDHKAPVHSRFIVKELVVKTKDSITVYLDDLQLDLDYYTIFNSGLLKLTTPQYQGQSQSNIRNYSSHVTLTPDSLEKLMKFVKYWSEIYSPIIQEIVPEAIFNVQEQETLDIDMNMNMDIRGVIVESKGEDGENSIELELDIEGLTETESSDTTYEATYDSYTDYSDYSNYSDTNDTNDISKHTAQLQLYESVDQHVNLVELLNEIDEQFFVNKKPTELNTNGIKLIDFGLEIDLILPETRFKISLTGIEGNFSSGTIDLKVKDCLITNTNNNNNNNTSNVVMGKWQKGPDVTCKYPIEDGNFLKIQAEKTNEFQKGIDEYNLGISVSPLRLFLDQKSMNSLMQFFQGDDYGNVNSTDVRGFIFFNKVNISTLALKIDYKPNDPTAVALPLQGAEMILPRIELRGVKGIEGLGPAILATWIPELKGSKLAGVLKTGLLPVRTIVNLGGGVVELILLPWQLGTGTGTKESGGSAAQTVAHIRRSSKQIGLETLKLTTTLANQTTLLLRSNVSSGYNRYNTFSNTSSYPNDFQSGVQQAAQLIVALPTRLHAQNQQKGPLRFIPLLILDSAATATGALAKTLQGIQAEFDRETGIERKLKKGSSR